ncbi:hypothetical protein D3C72_1113510 [compost metagenome]
MQARDLHHHLVGVGRAVEGAGAGRVIGADLALQQGGAVHLVLGVERPDAGLLGVGNARGHRPCGGEHDRQMAERQRPHEQARHDLVADAQHHGGVKGIVGQGHARRHGDGVAAEQRQFHAGAPLRDAVAHGGGSARHLGRGADLAHRLADHVGEALERLMGRQHVVVGGDHAHVGLGPVHRREFVGDGLAGEGVGPVGAGQLGPPGAAVAGGVHAAQVVGAGGAAAFDDAGGDLGHDRMQGRVESHQTASVQSTSRGTLAAIRAAMGWVIGSPSASRSKTARLAAPLRARTTRRAPIR